MKKTASKPRKTIDDLQQYGFGTGVTQMATKLAIPAADYLLAQGIGGLNTLLGGKTPTGDNNFNFNEGGQIMAFGGEADDGDPKAKKDSVNTKSSTYDPSLLTNGKFLVTKPDGSLGQWGNPVSNPIDQLLNPTPAPIILPSDKAAGFSNTYYPSRNVQTGKSVDAIPHHSYAMGGTIKIKPSHKGRFTAWAKEHHMGVSEAASHVMANKGKYSSHVVKMANFAHNFAALGDSNLGRQGQGNVPVEVEGGEVAQTPDGNVSQFQGPSHENGGIPANLPQGTKIYSDRLAVDGKTMQQRKLAREKQVGKLNNMLDKNPTDTINRNTYNRTKNAVDMEEQQDLMMQDAANQIYQKVPQLQSPGEQPDMSNQVPGAGAQFAYGTDEDGNLLPQYDPSLNTSFTRNSVADPNLADPRAVSTDMPYTTGDKIGFTGNVLAGALPLATTIANRAGDKPNVNAFQNFGQAAIDANDKGMGFLGAVRDSALKNVQTNATAQRARNRNSSTGVNTSRALDIATSGQEDTSENNIYSSYAQQMAGMYNERSKLANQKDLYSDTGQQTANRSDRMDRDSYYTNLGENLSNVAHQTQQTGKEINEHDYNNQVLSLLPYLNKYGLGFTYDENGKIQGMSKVKN